MEYKIRGKFLIYASKQLDKEMAGSLIINYTKLPRVADLYTKQYMSNYEFEKDKNKHYPDIRRFGGYKFGFMVRNAHRFRAPIAYPGRLRFFEVHYPSS